MASHLIQVTEQNFYIENNNLILSHIRKIMSWASNREGMTRFGSDYAAKNFGHGYSLRRFNIYVTIVHLFRK